MQKADDKYGCVELLLQYCKTCRVTACLPVIALDDKYATVSCDPNTSIDADITGLVSTQQGQLNFDLLLAHLRRAWKTQNKEDLITYMKLISMTFDHEVRNVTKKGMSYLLQSSSRKKPHVGLVVLSMLCKDTDYKPLKYYIADCYHLANVKDAPVRLILFAPIAHVLFPGHVQKEEEIALGSI